MLSGCIHVRGTDGSKPLAARTRSRERLDPAGISARRNDSGSLTYAWLASASARSQQNSGGRHRRSVESWPERSRNGDYRPYAAEKRCRVRARRPKPRKLDRVELALQVELRLVRNWSPEQIRDDLARSFPNRPEMHVSHETIYQSLFVQGRGHLRADLHKHLRTGRAIRRHRGEPRRASWSKIRDMILISERPAEADDRAVPGHWEGDLIVGINARSAIGTLVERTTRYVMLLHLPTGTARTRSVTR